jgi:GNAT superfamily N-acetyltransferase
MLRHGRPDLIEVNAKSLDETGFFCYMSKRKTAGYRRKREWLRARFSEGLGMKMLRLPERGFIEYVPGEYAWRSVEAEGYLFIHCLWVVGRSKGKGYGSLLLEECVKEAQKRKMRGVAIIASERPWLVDKRLPLKSGFEIVDRAPPSFTLLVRKFGKVTSPRFTGNWEEKSGQFREGLTVVRTDQCPYLENATNGIVSGAHELGIPARALELRSSSEARKRCPSAYGTFSVVYEGRLLSYMYLSKDELERSVLGLRSPAPRRRGKPASTCR